MRARVARCAGRARVRLICQRAQREHPAIRTGGDAVRRMHGASPAGVPAHAHHPMVEAQPQPTGVGLELVRVRRAVELRRAVPEHAEAERAARTADAHAGADGVPHLEPAEPTTMAALARRQVRREELVDSRRVYRHRRATLAVDIVLVRPEAKPAAALEARGQAEAQPHARQAGHRHAHARLVEQLHLTVGVHPHAQLVHSQHPTAAGWAQRIRRAQLGECGGLARELETLEVGHRSVQARRAPQVSVGVVVRVEHSAHPAGQCEEEAHVPRHLCDRVERGAGDGGERVRAVVVRRCAPQLQPTGLLHHELSAHAQRQVARAPAHAVGEGHVARTHATEHEALRTLLDTQCSRHRRRARRRRRALRRRSRSRVGSWRRRWQWHFELLARHLVPRLGPRGGPRQSEHHAEVHVARWVRVRGGGGGGVE